METNEKRLCSKCQAEIPSDSGFCPYCGEKLPDSAPGALRCPNCNNQVDEDDTFCPYCGEKLPEKVIIPRCPRCEKEIDGDDAFCPYCGTDIANYKKGKSAGKLKALLSSGKKKAGEKTTAPEGEKGKPSKKKVIAAIVIAATVCLLAVLGWYLVKYESVIEEQSIQIRELENDNRQLKKTIDTKDSDLDDLNVKYRKLSSDYNDILPSGRRYDEIVSILKKYSNRLGWASDNYYANTEIIFIRNNMGPKSIKITCKYYTTVYFRRESGAATTAEWDKNWNNNTTKTIFTPVRTGVDVYKFTAEDKTDTFYVIVVVY